MEELKGDNEKNNVKEKENEEDLKDSFEYLKDALE